MILPAICSKSSQITGDAWNSNLQVSFSSSTEKKKTLTISFAGELPDIVNSLPSKLSSARSYRSRCDFLHSAFAGIKN